VERNSEEAYRISALPSGGVGAPGRFLSQQKSHRGQRMRQPAAENREERPAPEAAADATSISAGKE
ncbi:hypothetical protein P7K49_035770, partial [Saguinus oedipus]